MYIVVKSVEKQLYVLGKADMLKDAQKLLVKDFLINYLSRLGLESFFNYLSNPKLESVKTEILSLKEDGILELGLNHAWYSNFCSEDRNGSDWSIINTNSDSIMPLSNNTSEEAETELWDIIKNYLSITN